MNSRKQKAKSGKKEKTIKYIIGIDEAGRGPLAGPVSIGIICIHIDNFNLHKKKGGLLDGVRDSKQLSEKMREEFFARIKAAEKSGTLFSAVSLVGEKIIDKRGISFAIRLGIKRCLKRFHIFHCLEGAEICEILLDGSLKAPAEYINQKTIIGGDGSVPIIGLASICAKVIRDKKMKKLAKKYKQYGFEIHKGYGTKAHYKAIKEHGISEIHRRSYLKGLK